MSTDHQLWVRTSDGGVEGPLRRSELRARALEGRLETDAQFSLDGEHWIPADLIAGIYSGPEGGPATPGTPRTPAVSPSRLSRRGRLLAFVSAASAALCLISLFFDYASFDVNSNVHASVAGTEFKQSPYIAILASVAGALAFCVFKCLLHPRSMAAVLVAKGLMIPCLILAYFDIPEPLGGGMGLMMAVVATLIGGAASWLFLRSLDRMTLGS